MEYSYLKRKIRQLLDIDIDAYKSAQMRRRLEAFVARQECGSAFRFCKTVERDQAALEELRDMLTINVSEFFRDSPPFEQLATLILPQLLRSSTRLNVWTAGCSHGQEPYSLAILLDELSEAYTHRILATDVDTEALKRATAGGPYLPAETRNVSVRRLQKYFVPAGEGHVVIEKLRRRVQFGKHNLLADPFATGLDLLVCRNVMIYFSGEVKRKLFRQFHESLNPGGVLFVGGTEALLSPDNAGFERLSTNFYRKVGAADAEKRRRMAA
jgi:chemotaxis protein methyltransferase CheR